MKVRKKKAHTCCVCGKMTYRPQIEQLNGMVMRLREALEVVPGHWCIEQALEPPKEPCPTCELARVLLASEPLPSEIDGCHEFRG
jgi:hypothetical protein